MSLPDGLELARTAARPHHDTWLELEWLETNRLGSFCLACVDRKLRRKYHALLTVRDPGRGDAWNLLAETRETLILGDQRALLVDPLSGESSNSTLCSFSATPHATHTYRALGATVERSVRLAARDQVEVRYRLRDLNLPEATTAQLIIEPLLRCRPLHELTHENPFLDGTCVKLNDEVRMLPYAGMPAIAMRVYGERASFEDHGSWLTVPEYSWEAARGYEARESLFSPGCFSIPLSPAAGQAELTFVVGLHRVEAPREVIELASNQRRDSAPLAQAAAKFFASSTSREQALVAGYPWLSVLSHDALLALPGVYLATGSWESAAQVLAFLAKSRVRGLIADRPVFAGGMAGSASVEASLLFARTVQWFQAEVGADQVEDFMPVVCELLESLAEGSDPRVRFDRGVSVYSEPGPYALTWMNCMIGGRPVTPRVGYAVEIDALAYNAVHFACGWADLKRPGFARTFRNRLRNAEGEFVRRYWDDARGYLADSHDGEHADGRLTPNQLWALALPHRPVSGALAHSALVAVTRDLWTPFGLRTLSPHDPRYQGRCQGGPAARDRAAHQGSVWPWLTAIYADATLLTLGQEALDEHVAPILANIGQHLTNAGCLGQVSELFDGDAPHRPGGAPARAASVAELYRTQRLLENAASHATSVETAVRPRAGHSADGTAAAKRTQHENQHPRETLSK
jgi:predicted glycogen debranching enzyme